MSPSQVQAKVGIAMNVKLCELTNTVEPRKSELIGTEICSDWPKFGLLGFVCN